MGEIGEGDQTANQTSKPLKKEKKKITNSGRVQLQSYLF
jgi:hypothetical protein